MEALFLTVLEWFRATRDFIFQGGPILEVIAWVTLLMWILVVERLSYLATTHKKRARPSEDMCDRTALAAGASSNIEKVY